MPYTLSVLPAAARFLLKLRNPLLLARLERAIQALAPPSSSGRRGYMVMNEMHESAELLAELDRRLAEFQADPNIATPFEPDYFENLKHQLAGERAAKTSARSSRHD